MTLSTVAIIGAGTMGGGIAISCVLAGLRTLVFDANPAMLEQARARVARHVDRLADKGKRTPQEALAAAALFQPVGDLDQLRDADLVIEAIHEDLAAKRALFARLSGLVGDHALIATNTSALRVGDLAQAVRRPDRFLGLHYFSPAEVNPLVELVLGPQTAATAAQAAQTFLERTGKTVLRCRDANGFAVNRFFCPYANEAARLLDDGLASTGQIDQVARDLFDLALGPFEVMNIVKPRIMLNAVGNLSALGSFYAPAAGLERIGAQDAAWVIEEMPAALPDDQRRQVEERLCAALWLPVLEAASERVASFPDFDLGARAALRFGKPPVALMQAVGRNEVARLVGAMAQRHCQPVPEDGLNLLFG